MNAVFYRAFGDFKFKWDRETIESTFGAVLGDNAFLGDLWIFEVPTYCID
jgi:hypothetical protein